MKKVKKIILHNFWWKIISLIIAIIIWLYVNEELSRMRQGRYDVKKISSPSSFYV